MDLSDEPHFFENLPKKLIIMGHIIGQIFTVTVKNSDMKIFHPLNEGWFFHPFGKCLF
jgi:hypothetical protein